MGPDWICWIRGSIAWRQVSPVRVTGLTGHPQPLLGAVSSVIDRTQAICVQQRACRVHGSESPRSELLTVSACPGASLVPPRPSSRRKPRVRFETLAAPRRPGEGRWRAGFPATGTTDAVSGAATAKSPGHGRIWGLSFRTVLGSDVASCRWANRAMSPRSRGAPAQPWSAPPARLAFGRRPRRPEPRYFPSLLASVVGVQTIADANWSARSSHLLDEAATKDLAGYSPAPGVPLNQARDGHTIAAFPVGDHGIAQCGHAAIT